MTTGTIGTATIGTATIGTIMIDTISATGTIGTVMIDTTSATGTMTKEKENPENERIQEAIKEVFTATSVTEINISSATE